MKNKKKTLQTQRTSPNRAWRWRIPPSDTKFVRGRGPIRKTIRGVNCGLNVTELGHAKNLLADVRDGVAIIVGERTVGDVAVVGRTVSVTVRFTLVGHAVAVTVATGRLRPRYAICDVARIGYSVVVAIRVARMLADELGDARAKERPTRRRAIIVDFAFIRPAVGVAILTAFGGDVAFVWNGDCPIRS